jgi:DNA modification methylase
MELPWNEPQYGVDCLDPEHGMPRIAELVEEGTLPRIDLCLTDPPYDTSNDTKVDAIKASQIEDYREKKGGKRHYVDTIEDYEDFSLRWLDLALRCCRGAVFSCGTPHYYDWIAWRRPPYITKYWYKSNSCSPIKADPLLFYGKVKRFVKVRQVIDIPMGKRAERDLVTLHPTPKPLELYIYLLSRLRPGTVLDPFLGSGTTAQACEKLGIRHITFELDAGYRVDWEERRRDLSPVRETVPLDRFFISR